MTAPEIIKDLYHGLVLRSARAADAETLSAFNSTIHGSENEIDRIGVGAWTQDLLTCPHPTFSPGDFTVVEDVRQGKIISSLNLISQTWAYGGVPFGVGRIELVGTDPEYRRHGLVREQFEVIHRWSQERGELIQVITGIPFYYRQFGYEMALDLGGGRIGYTAQIPELPAGQPEPYRVRPAVEADLPFIAEIEACGARRGPLSAVRDLEMWRYELSGKRSENICRNVLCLIESAAGDPAGFLMHPWFLWSMGLAMVTYELKEGLSYWEVSPSVMRYLAATGQAYAAASEKTASPASPRKSQAVYYWLGQDHPLYAAYPHRMSALRTPYAFYVRVHDLAAFIRTVAPALEGRLSQSVCCGYSGELKLSFYKSGLRLTFDRGRLTSAVNLNHSELSESAAGFPGLTFLQLVFGYRSLAELRTNFADCWVNEDKALALLNALFPRCASNVISIS